MAITDIPQYAHLSTAQVDALGAELDAIRRDVEASLGHRDAAYIRRTIQFQRALEVSARVLLAASRSKAGWIAGVTSLALAKSVENMELGHNITHGQWDWMNDPEIHSTTWEWDMAGLSSQWRYSHNAIHHVYTNVLGMDDDIGFGVMRVTRDEPWQRRHLWQPLHNILLALTFEWGIARHGLHAEQDRADTAEQRAAHGRQFTAKATRQLAKDYVLTPALGGRRWRRVLSGNLAANVLRNLWAYAVIFCGHFPDGAAKFTTESVTSETKSEWYVRQMLGTANFTAGPTLAFLSGNLCYQIEHHLFPDLPSNRYPQIAARVRALCAHHDLPYNSASLARQFLLAQRTILKLAVPDRLLRATSDDAPETASERRFHGLPPVAGQGLRTALRRLDDRKVSLRRARRRLARQTG
ncbi:acyl-CoA desaturase [Mycobacterium sp. MYCO198283]|uniref:fatty acid desaturase family protein n=1 Tax=Mycobacterium sp. MYCO198283 TaxID=2883505 RepID=UPI001E47C6C3|nr:acyl-CoA desaturase [Mycobacterium sp. MYCO198283]MCG5432405.1 acyl-CoA desaturase [Mycobacterium sp. MYCO198283]